MLSECALFSEIMFFKYRHDQVRQKKIQFRLGISELKAACRFTVTVTDRRFTLFLFDISLIHTVMYFYEVIIHQWLYSEYWWDNIGLPLCLGYPRRFLTMEMLE